LYIHIIHKRNAFVRRLLTLWVTIALAGSLANLSAAMHALSTPWTSLVMLGCMSLVESVFPLIVVFADARIRGRMQTPWAQIVLFPVLWATLWSGIVHINPIGRLSPWSPVQGFGAYRWLSPFAGPSGIDWVVAACAVICSELIGAWLMGPQDEESRIIELDEDERPSTLRQSESRWHVLVLSVIIAMLTLPSFIPTGVPLPPSSADTTPLTVGCVLPSSIYDKQHASKLEDFIAASAQMTSARILIWPESAVTFANPEEREAAFDEVRRRVRGPAVGVSFEEFLPADSGGRVGMKRNCFALLTPNKSKGPAVMLSYYKRHLVPGESNAYIVLWLN
jgi:hypothetical protein